MFGERLRAIRMEVGHTQQSLAEMINVEPKQIWRWESDKNAPDVYTVVKLAQALNVSSDYLVGLTDDKTPSELDMDKLTAEERSVIAAWRRGDIRNAIRPIVG